MCEKIEYDCFGRMKYNPEFHPNMGKPWTIDDTKYLAKWYDKIGADEMSFALGRTISSVMQRVNELRKVGIMPKAIRRSHKRTYDRNF